ncbi:hypothetical protein [Pedosphaera parvula]|uniref:Uncharacterized protein n=1 Tax=Pedosphaera parvula (strain Ellin514) TaxID=320771 RepID=B9XFA7_PEDPL|nr:hypothetical protein [Pedosphaera parvula]EEF61605.1 hypothetical protein Cflav_PD4284 [Pedosphaera parvula Ellin514]
MIVLPAKKQKDLRQQASLFQAFRMPLQMKVLVQDCQTELYFSGSDSWTSDPEEAIDFGHVPRAAEFLLESRGLQADIILHFGHPAYDLRLKGTR